MKKILSFCIQGLRDQIWAGVSVLLVVVPALLAWMLTYAPFPWKEQSLVTVHVETVEIEKIVPDVLRRYFTVSDAGKKVLLTRYLIVNNSSVTIVPSASFEAPTVFAPAGVEILQVESCIDTFHIGSRVIQLVPFTWTKIDDGFESKPRILNPDQATCIDVFTRILADVHNGPISSISTRAAGLERKDYSSLEDFAYDADRHRWTDIFGIWVELRGAEVYVFSAAQLFLTIVSALLLYPLLTQGRAPVVIALLLAITILSTANALLAASLYAGRNVIHPASWIFVVLHVCVVVLLTARRIQRKSQAGP